jgi:hypothetical protein
MKQKLSSFEKTALEDFLITFDDKLEFYLGGRGTSLTEPLHHIYNRYNPKGINIGLQRYKLNAVIGGLHWNYLHSKIEKHSWREVIVRKFLNNFK